MPMGALPLALLLAASGLARIRAQGEVRWGGDLQGGEPYVFRDPRDPEKLVGFEVDLVRALAPSLGVRERFVHNDWSNLVPSLERGDFDLIVNGLEDTQALRRRILLSRPYFSFAERYGLTKPDLELADGDVARGSYVIGMRKGDEDLRDAVDSALVGLETEGELRRIFARWRLPELPARAAPEQPDEPPPATFDRAQVVLFVRAAGITLAISLLAMALAVPLGLLLALARLYGRAPARLLAHGYIELFRGTPVLLQLFILYYGIAPIVHLSAPAAAILGLGLNYGAYEAEVHRAAIQAIPAGQAEAAASLGLSRAQALRLVLLPQAVRTALPAMTNDLIALLKDSSLVSVITVVELTKQMTITAVDVRSWALPGALCAGLYFAMSYPLARLAARLEARLGDSAEEPVTQAVAA